MYHVCGRAALVLGLVTAATLVLLPGWWAQPRTGVPDMGSFAQCLKPQDEGERLHACHMARLPGCTTHPRFNATVTCMMQGRQQGLWNLQGSNRKRYWWRPKVSPLPCMSPGHDGDGLSKAVGLWLHTNCLAWHQRRAVVVVAAESSGGSVTRHDSQPVRGAGFE